MKKCQPTKLDLEVAIKLGRRILELLGIQPDDRGGSIELQLLRDGSVRVVARSSRGECSGGGPKN